MIERDLEYGWIIERGKTGYDRYWIVYMPNENFIFSFSDDYTRGRAYRIFKAIRKYHKQLRLGAFIDIPYYPEIKLDILKRVIPIQEYEPIINNSVFENLRDFYEFKMDPINFIETYNLREMQ